MHEDSKEQYRVLVSCICTSYISNYSLHGLAAYIRALNLLDSSPCLLATGLRVTDTAKLQVLHSSCRIMNV